MAKSSGINPELLLSQKLPEKTFTYTERDAAIYALGVGACGRDAVDADELKYVYHENGQQFIQVLPTFSALFSFELEPSGAIDLPGLQHDPRLLLHGQQYMELYKPFPSSASIRNEACIAGLHDKGKAAILEIETKSYNAESGELLCMNRHVASNFIIAGIQSFLYLNSCVELMRALVYRLSGDYNPLHSDPMVAKAAGGDPNMVKNIFSRFLLHVYPGETLVTEMWLQGLRVIYQVKVKERNRSALSGFVDVHRLASSL
ncbi:Enoyl-CoA hydratase 2 (peroxisomal) [Citrus sinensis]|uniref:Enoyl-CoA hydratase 2 (Peroxisomal) n=1 Tax=Citrus sinensis TaxID=2711 RepID=A0ACB8KYH6_CITSI|nr:Enoyl-CoA hydratase 2 (peroxisomal) [Citrus sinensis]